MTVNAIASDMTFDELDRLPEFEAYKKFFIYSPGVKGISETQYKGVRIDEISTVVPTWNGKSIVAGLNHLLHAHRSERQVLYKIWSEDEAQSEANKEDSVLFHFPGEAGKPFAIVCAGGAYMAVASMVEAFPIAKRLNELGYTAFVLNYRVGKQGILPEPMEDLAQAIKFIVSQADAFEVASNDYAVAGFSAGGHLAATLGTTNDGYKRFGVPKPAALFLGYPLISMDALFENDSKALISAIMAGRDYTCERLDAFSIHKNMDENYPPTYIWMCKDDETIPFSNSVILADRLHELGIPHVHKLVERGGHGIGIGDGTEAEGWLDEAVQFWSRRFA